jgi:hypothetical protein
MSVNILPIISFLKSVAELRHFEATPDSAPSTRRQNHAALALTTFPWLTVNMEQNLKKIYSLMRLRLQKRNDSASYVSGPISCSSFGSATLQKTTLNHNVCSTAKLLKHFATNAKRCVTPKVFIDMKSRCCV